MADFYIMRVVIQDIESQKYLARNGSWTPAARDAEDFRFSPSAYATAGRRNARQIRVILYFEDLDYSIAARRWQDYSRLFRASDSGLAEIRAASNMGRPGM